MRRRLVALVVALLVVAGCSKPWWNTCKVSRVACSKTVQVGR